MTTPDGEADRPGQREAEAWGEYEWSEPSPAGANDPLPPNAPPVTPAPTPAPRNAPPATPAPVSPEPPPVTPAPDPPGAAPRSGLENERAARVADDADPTDLPAIGPPAASGAPRVYRGELTSALGALALFALMFATKWYGVAGVPDPSAARPAISTAENAWDGLSLVRWVMIGCILAVLGSVVLHASQRAHGTRTNTSLVILGLGGLTFALLFYRVLLVLPQADRVIDQKLGAVLGLGCALAITLGGVESVREQQRFQRDLARRPRRRQHMRTGRDDRWSPTGDHDRVVTASSIWHGPGGTGQAAHRAPPQPQMGRADEH